MLIFTHIENKVTNPKNLIFFICQKKFNITKKELVAYRRLLQIPILNKIKQGELKSAQRSAEEKKALLKKKNIYYNPNWPCCLYDPLVFNLKEFVVIKESKPPFIIDDYYYIKNEGYHDDLNDMIDRFFISNKTANNGILIERHKHACDDQKIVDISQNFTNLENVYSNESVDKDNDKSQEMKIYELVKKNKDVDKITNYIKEELRKTEENTLLVNEIDIINEKNKNFIYYTKNYFNDK